MTPPRANPETQRWPGVMADAAQRGLDPWRTFEAIRELAGQAAGLAGVGGTYNRPLHAGARPPRMTEPWFC